MEKPDFNSALQIIAIREGLIVRLKHLISERNFYWSEIKRFWSASPYFSPDGEHIVFIASANVLINTDRELIRPKLNAIEEEIYKTVLPPRG